MSYVRIEVVYKLIQPEFIYIADEYAQLFEFNNLNSKLRSFLILLLCHALIAPVRAVIRTLVLGCQTRICPKILCL